MSNELDEKFVADHSGGDVVKPAEAAEPTTAAGGAIKKKKADVKKSVDPTADKVPATVSGQADGGSPMKEDSEVEAEDHVEEIIEIDSSIEQMFEGMDLSEEFKDKVSLVFEAAVNEAATKKAESAITEKVEAMETEMKESLDTAIDGIVENLDSYLDYVVEEWMKENELAIETGVKVEMAESLMSGLKDILEEHNKDVSEETNDVVGELESELEQLKVTANEGITENVELQKQIAELKAEKVFDEMTEDLTITQKERLKVLSEKLDFSNADEYKADLETLKESFFKKDAKVTEAADADSEEEIITEESAQVKKPASDHYSINALVEALDARRSAEMK
jgi:hypothetical protein